MSITTEQIMQAVEDYANALVLERSEDEVRSDEVMRRIRHVGARRVSLKAAIEALVQERDELKADLVFVERWANHHGQKSCHSAESILGVIQHYPTIRAITKSYADGVVPDTSDPYAERDKLAAENKVLRDAWSAEPVAWLSRGSPVSITRKFTDDTPLYTRSKS
jgi:hypothetical protein